MGLDMYVIRRVRRNKKDLLKYTDYKYRSYYNKEGEEVGFEFSDWHKYSDEDKKLVIKKSSKIVDTYELAYWRKANQIHKWFVDNVQHGEDNCEDYKLKKSDLKKLYNICNKLLDKIVLEDGQIVNGYSYKKDSKGELVPEYHYEPGKVIKNPEVCKKLLPTQEGFFFGSTDYNQFYYEDIVYTRDTLKEILDKHDFAKEDIYYTSSW